MNSPPEPQADEPRLRYSARLSAISGILSLLVAGGAILALIGWWWGIDLLNHWLPDQLPMNPLAALLFLLAAGSLRLHLLPARVCAGMVVAFGLMSLAASPVGWTYGMDPISALGFVLIGLALMLLERNGGHPGWRWTVFLPLPVLLLSMLALFGQFYGSGQTPLPTALLFHLLAWGALLAQPDRGFMKVVLDDGPGGMLARRLFPAMIVTLGLLGRLRVEGESHGYFSAGMGAALHITANIVILGLIIWWSARELQKAGVLRHRSDAVLEGFFTCPLDMLCIAGSDGYFKRLNPAFSQTLGYTTEELLSRPYLDLVHPDDRAATLAAAAKLGKGQTVMDVENRYQCKDGSWKWLSWKVQPAGPKGLQYATARDVTESKQSAADIKKLNADLQHQASQLLEANRELEAFSYSISHDLRAPLRHVLGYMEMLVNAIGSGLPEKPRRYLDTIRSATEQMGQLIDALLAFSKAGRTELSTSEIAMDELVCEVIRDLDIETADRDIVWEIAPLSHVNGDRAMLKQVLANLIGNSVKYTRGRAPATIRIGSKPGEDGQVIFFVRDNGAGFDMRYVKKLFGVFQRLHREDEFEGTGIGLANVRRIVTRHGGQTWAEGEPGRGATFSFSLWPSTFQPEKIPTS